MSRVRSPTLATFVRFIFSSRVLSSTEEHKIVCVTLQELAMWPVMYAVITGKNYFVAKMGRYNKYRAKQCTHTSWWLVLGWVTTKEYHPCIRFRNDTLHVNIGLHLHFKFTTLTLQSTIAVQLAITSW